MKIHGTVMSEGKSITDAIAQLWLVKRLDGTEIKVAYDLRSVDDGAIEFSRDVVDGLPCNSQHFDRIKYDVEKSGYQRAQGSRLLDNEEIELGNIDLAQMALRVQGRITSNRRLVKAVTVVIQIDDVERASIRTDHEGKFTRDVDGDYEGHTLVWTATRFGYVSATGSIEVSSTTVDVGEVDLAPHWWTGICQNLGIDPRVVLGVLLSLGLGLALVIYFWRPTCLESSVTAADFRKDGVNSRDIETAFSECLFISQGQCGKDKDARIRQCLENRSYKYSK